MQKGQIVKISGRWYVRYRERRNVDGMVQQKRVSHCLGPITTKGKHPPADIVNAAADHLAGVTRAAIPAERVTTIGQFVEGIYLPWVDGQKRPSTARAYHDIWNCHLRPVCADSWMKNVRTFHVQTWLNEISGKGLSRNTLKHIKSALSAIFKVAKQQGYFDGLNPVMDTAVSPNAAPPEETYAYSLDEVNAILRHLPEPAATAFAIAAFAGLRVGEIEALRWEDYRNAEINVSRSRWNGRETAPKTAKSRAPVPVIRQLAERLQLHQLRSGGQQSGPIFATTKGTPLTMNNIVKRLILPALNRCSLCHKPQTDHLSEEHNFARDARLPEWHGWHAARRGLGSNLNSLGVDDSVIQRILRHSNISVTQSYYIKSMPADVQSAMSALERSIPETQLDSVWTPQQRATIPM